ncbi:MAG: glutaredoxin family protein [Planctomycetes bacterium]|nr:glutaredoxin family protein [Planctomycetota bacterium]
MAAPVPVTLYTREGCHLCEAAREAILRGGEGLGIELREIDVDSDPDLARRFGEEVPVVFIGERKAFKYRLTPEAFRDRLRRLELA